MLPEPHVLAFVQDWPPAAEGEAIRAHLRGLGAHLVLVVEGAAWRIGPDDGEPIAIRPPVEPCGLRPPAFFVVDGAGAVRFAHAPATPAPGDLLAALEAAGRALLGSRATMMTRREWLVSSLVAGFTIALLDGCSRRAQPAEAAPQPTPGELDITLTINGAPRTLRVEPRVSLLDALRERLALPGTKKGCDHGQCGACTVIVDGRRVLSCLTLAVALPGANVTTIEGLAAGDALHPVQAAFLVEDAFQCGYCTPGQIMSAVGLLAEGRAGSDEEVREAMSGNLCRCGAYPNIVAAIQRARRRA